MTYRIAAQLVVFALTLSLFVLPTVTRPDAASASLGGGIALGDFTTGTLKIVGDRGKVYRLVAGERSPFRDTDRFYVPACHRADRWKPIGPPVKVGSFGWGWHKIQNWDFIYIGRIRRVC